jgi:hypothetical protein
LGDFFVYFVVLVHFCAGLGDPLVQAAYFPRQHKIEPSGDNDGQNQGQQENGHLTPNILFFSGIPEGK